MQYTFKAPKGKWAIPVVCTLSDDSRIVLGLKENAEADWKKIEDLGVNIARFLEIMSFLETPETQNVITGVLQMGSGLGRNAFGKEYKGGEFNYAAISAACVLFC